MGKSARRKLIAALIGVVLALLLGEALLALFDPLGFAYYRDQVTLATQVIADPRGYNFRPGTLRLSGFSYTILPDGTRAVPATDPLASQTLVLMGDSVTFAYGVDDERAWGNLIAAQLPGARVINAGVSGYNSTNVLRTLAQYPDADALLYLIVNNDAAPENHPILNRTRPLDQSSWLALYLLNLPEYLFPRSVSDEITHGDIPRYLADLRQITADHRVLAVAFNDEFGRMTVREGFNIPLIERGTDRVSPADGHPGVRGNQEIARQVLPLIRQRFGW